MTHTTTTSPEAKKLTTHYHCASGLPGHGPDQSEKFAVAWDGPELAAVVRGEFIEGIESLSNYAESLAASGDYEGAWRAKERIDELTTLYDNLDNARFRQPLFAHAGRRWEDLSLELALEADGTVTDVQSIHVWKCRLAAEQCHHCVDEHGNVLRPPIDGDLSGSSESESSLEDFSRYIGAIVHAGSLEDESLFAVSAFEVAFVGNDVGRTVGRFRISDNGEVTQEEHR